MQTQISTVEELQQLFLETVLNKTDKISKISEGSVLSALGFGVAKVGQKAMKEIALVEAHLDPDVATGDQLDTMAAKRGVAGRFGASTSSTYLFLRAAPGTEYTAGVHAFSGTGGGQFTLENNLTVSDAGYAYVKVRSASVGLFANVGPLSLTRVSPAPSGHQYVINEFGATGGRDDEPDDEFRQRIKDSVNIAAKETLAKLDQLFIRVNSNVLRCYYQGHNERGQLVVAVATQNGIDLTPAELTQLVEQSQGYLALTDLRYFRSRLFGIAVKNVEWFPVDLAFRVALQANADPDQVRVDIQRRLARLLDFRFWTDEKLVEWDNLLEATKAAKGVQYVPDTFFQLRPDGGLYGRTDLRVDLHKLPRLRGFQMLDLNGTVILDRQGNLNPVYFPSQPDPAFQATIL